MQSISCPCEGKAIKRLHGANCAELAAMIFARADFTNTGICHETVMNLRLAVEMTLPAAVAKEWFRPV